MGKVKIKTLGDEQTEQEEKAKEEEKRRQKALRKGETLPTQREEEKRQVEPEKKLNPNLEEGGSEIKKEEAKTKPTKKEKFAKEKEQSITRSKSYQGLAAKIDKTKAYPLAEGLNALNQLQRGKFDETVELHINTAEQGVSGQVTLPHGTGKKVRVAVADDKLLEQVLAGKIEFDILLATPDMMPKLARAAKVLGPRGLMPNPKNGTVTTDPAETAKKFEGGQMSFKTEKSPIIHVAVGKVSFGEKKLEENIKTLLGAIPGSKIVNVTLKSTMSPGIKLAL